MKSIKLLSALFKASDEDVRRAYIIRMADAKKKRSQVATALTSNGYETVSTDEIITVDGREVITAGSAKWALRPEVHAERLATEFEAARKHKTDPATKSVVGTESLSQMTCPRCGDSLQHTSVCPKCAAGKLGYRHRYTCVCGGVDLISKDKL